MQYADEMAVREFFASLQLQFIADINIHLQRPSNEQKINRDTYKEQ